jgi:hypothetical protein
MFALNRKLGERLFLQMDNRNYSYLLEHQAVESLNSSI